MEWDLHSRIIFILRSDFEGSGKWKASILIWETDLKGMRCETIVIPQIKIT